MINEKLDKNVYEVMSEGLSFAEKAIKKRGFSIRSAILVLILILSVALSVIVEFFTGQIGVDVLASVEFWLNKLAINLAVVAVLLIAREAFKDREKNVNSDYRELTGMIHGAYLSIMNSGADDKFQTYIAEENARRKLRAYRYEIGEKLVALKNKRRKIELTVTDKTKREKKLYKVDRKVELLNKKIETSEEDIDFLKVKYVKISYAQIFGAEEQQRENDEDFSPHEQGHVAVLLRNRALWFVAFGIVFGVIASSFLQPKEINLGVIMSAINNTICLLMGMFWGASDGAYFVKTTITNKLRLRCSFVEKFKRLNGISNAKQEPTE